MARISNRYFELLADQQDQLAGKIVERLAKSMKR